MIPENRESGSMRKRRACPTRLTARFCQQPSLPHRGRNGGPPNLPRNVAQGSCPAGSFGNFFGQDCREACDSACVNNTCEPQHRMRASHKPNKARGMPSKLKRRGAALRPSLRRRWRSRSSYGSNFDVAFLLPKVSNWKKRLIFTVAIPAAQNDPDFFAKWRTSSLY